MISTKHLKYFRKKLKKDIEGFIQTKIINAQPITISILIGKAAVIDSDIKQQLEEAITFYKIFS